MSALLRTIEADVIPRLVLAHKTNARTAAETVPGDGSHVPGPDEVSAFTKLMLEDDLEVASNFAKKLLDEGASLEGLFLELFAPTARRLGEFWVADLCDFTQVTIGVGRLQQLLREFAHAGWTPTDGWQQGRRAVLAPTPGEQHSFGLLIVGEFLRRAGWDVTGELAPKRSDLCALVDGEWFAVIGFSLSSEQRLGELMRTIRAVRRASRNHSIGVMVGGRVFSEHPEFVQRVGADASALDGSQAARRAEELLALFVSGRRRDPDR